MDIESIILLAKAGFSADDIRSMMSHSQTPAQPVKQMQTPAQPVQQMQTPAQPVQQMQTPAIDNQLLSGLMNSITGLQNAIQAQAIFYTQQPQMLSGAQMADDALASIVLPSNNS